jgi:hypothetical protein
MNARQARQRRALFYPHWLASAIPPDRTEDDPIEDSTNNLSQTDDPMRIVVPSSGERHQQDALSLVNKVDRERGISPKLSPVNTVEPERRTPPQLSPVNKPEPSPPPPAQAATEGLTPLTLAAVPAAPKLIHPRCRFSFSDGRRCRMPSAEPNARFCAHHARKTKKPRKQSHASPAFVELQTPSGKFTTATDLNYALSQVFRSLARNRIRPRNAAALGYLGQLLLQTLPGVKSEFSNTFGYRAWDESVKAMLNRPSDQDGRPERIT